MESDGAREIMRGTRSGLAWAPVMPLAAATASVPLALYERGWWVIVGGALVTAAGRYVAWRRAAAAVLVADATGLTHARGGRVIIQVPWKTSGTSPPIPVLLCLGGVGEAK